MSSTISSALDSFRNKYNEFLKTTDIESRLKATELQCLQEIPLKNFKPVALAVTLLRTSASDIAVSNPVLYDAISGLVETIEWKWNRFCAAIRLFYPDSSKTIAKVFSRIHESTESLGKLLNTPTTIATTQSQRMSDILCDPTLVESCLQPCLSDKAAALLKTSERDIEILQKFFRRVLQGWLGHRLRERLLDPLELFIYNQEQLLRIVLADFIIGDENPKAHMNIFNKVPKELLAAIVAGSRTFIKEWREFRDLSIDNKDLLYLLAFGRKQIPKELNEQIAHAISFTRLSNETFTALLEHLRPFFSPQNRFLINISLHLIKGGEYDRALEIIKDIQEPKTEQIDAFGEIVHAIILEDKTKGVEVLEACKDREVYPLIVQAVCKRLASEGNLSSLHLAYELVSVFKESPNFIDTVTTMVIQHSTNCLHKYSEPLPVQELLIEMIHTFPQNRVIECLSTSFTNYFTSFGNNTTNAARASLQWLGLVEKSFSHKPAVMSAIVQRLLHTSMTTGATFENELFEAFYKYLPAENRFRLLQGVASVVIQSSLDCGESIRKIKKIAAQLQNPEESSTLYEQGYLIFRQRRCDCHKEDELFEAITDPAIKGNVEFLRDSGKRLREQRLQEIPLVVLMRLLSLDAQVPLSSSSTL